MATTTHLGIALVEQSQSQKEVTVNQAFQRLDAILNNGAISLGDTTPPVTPATGDLYVLGASPTGSWSGHGQAMAYYDQIWRFITPNEGVTLWVNDEDTLYSYNGTSWSPTLTQFQNLSLLGVNAVADSTNKLAIASSAVLFNNIGANIQAKLNKHGSSDSASFLFQSNYSGRAEFGTLGDDNFTLKVSPDGSSWLDVLKMIASTGRMAIKSIGTGISAAGTDQATATALTKSFNQVTTVSSGQGVKLPYPEAGEMLLVANQGANALNVYPYTGHTINALSSNAATTISTDSRKLFIAVSSSQWYTI